MARIADRTRLQLVTVRRRPYSWFIARSSRAFGGRTGSRSAVERDGGAERVFVSRPRVNILDAMTANSDAECADVGVRNCTRAYRARLNTFSSSLPRMPLSSALRT